MKIYEIRDLLDIRFPSSLSEDWDNDGEMLVLDGESEVTGILTTLDVTDSAIDMAIECNANLIVSHHPLIFSGVKKISPQNWLGRARTNGLV